MASGRRFVEQDASELQARVPEGEIYKLGDFILFLFFLIWFVAASGNMSAATC